MKSLFVFLFTCPSLLAMQGIQTHQLICNQPLGSSDSIWNAAATGNTKDLEKYRDAGCTLSEQDAVIGSTPLMYAIHTGKKDAVIFLLDEGVDVDIPNNKKETALIIALDRDQKDIAALLIDSGAETNIQNRNGLTPLHKAVLNKDLNCIQKILNSGADVNAQSGPDLDDPHQKSRQRTALHWAIRITQGSKKKKITLMPINEAIKVVALLLKHGADPMIADFENRTALSWAERLNMSELVTLFKNKSFETISPIPARILTDDQLRKIANSLDVLSLNAYSKISPEIWGFLERTDLMLGIDQRDKEDIDNAILKVTYGSSLSPKDQKALCGGLHYILNTQKRREPTHQASLLMK